MTAMMVSVLIPTHNRAPRLARTLESLRALHFPADISLELIVVANACADGTADRVAEMAASFPSPLRCVCEERLGLGHARNRALREAVGDILAFLDDDVWADPDWLAGLCDVFATRPADLVAGRVRLWWEAVQRPAWMDTRSEHLLTCTDYGDQIIPLDQPGLAVGANFAFRRSVVDRVGLFSVTLDRTGESILGGGDTEFLRRALDAGCRMFYAPRAALQHWVDPRRITLPYLSAVAFGQGLARAFLPKQVSIPKAVGISLEYGFRTAAYTALETACRLAGLKGARIHNLIRRRTAFGYVAGTIRRMRHQSPAGAKGTTPRQG